MIVYILGLQKSRLQPSGLCDMLHNDPDEEAGVRASQPRRAAPPLTRAHPIAGRPRRAHLRFFAAARVDRRRAAQDDGRRDSCHTCLVCRSSAAGLTAGTTRSIGTATAAAAANTLGHRRRDSCLPRTPNQLARSRAFQGGKGACAGGAADGDRRRTEYRSHPSPPAGPHRR